MGAKGSATSMHLDLKVDEQEVSVVHFMINCMPLVADKILERDSRRTIRGTSSVIEAEVLNHS